MSKLIESLADPSLLRERCYISGKWIAAGSGRAIEVKDPSSRRVIVHVPSLSAEEVCRAIDSAEAAFASWRERPAAERGRIVRRWFELMTENAEDLAKIMTAEQGKPLAEARGEIRYSAGFLEWFAEEAKRSYGDTIPGPDPTRRIVTIKQPIGVCAAITPWNFPSAMITRKAGPALAAGCTMILKPASQTPLSALALAELAHRAGVPPGVFHVVTGSASVIGDALTRDPRVRKLSFTGSTEIGRVLMRDSAATIKKLSLELGGNAPFIVLDDADLDAAVRGCIASKFRNAGQTCVCANRIYVQEGVHDEFVRRLVAAVSTLRVGDGAEEGVTIGPLIDDAAVQKVEAHIADAVSKGGAVVYGGTQHPLGGSFFEPTVLTGCHADMDMAKEETFGPVAPIFRFASDAEVIRAANDTEFGLAAYVYGTALRRLWSVAEKLEFGIVGVNSGVVSNEAAPFGGVKQSGLGREGSKYGLDEFMEVKYLCVGELDA